MKKITISILSVLFIFNTTIGQSWKEVEKIYPDGVLQIGNDEKFGSAFDRDGEYAVVGASGTQNTIGVANVLQMIDTTWEKTQLLTSSDRKSGDYFGSSVSISGDYILVGARECDSTGSAYIFINNAGTWEENAKLTSSDLEVGDRFGNSVSICGDYAFVGAYLQSDSSAGAVYVFYNNAGTWEYSQKIVGYDSKADDYFGTSVNANSDFLIVGSPNNDELFSNAGATYIYENNAGVWELYQKITASDAAASDNFGSSVDINGDYLIVGAFFKNMRGTAYIFYNNAGTWEEQDDVRAADVGMMQSFGKSVSMGDGYALIGKTGAAYVYYNNAGSWEEQATLTPIVNGGNDYFGNSVYIADTFAFAGSNNYSGKLAYFKKPATGWVTKNEDKLFTPDETLGYSMNNFGVSVSFDSIYAAIGGSFTDSIKGSVKIMLNENGSLVYDTLIKASDGKPQDQFGLAVGVSKNYLISGAYKETTLGTDAGAAYIFKNTSGIWNEVKKLTASDGSDNHRFGYAVDIMDDIAFVGAYGNNSVYIYKENSGSWDETIIKASDTDGTESFGNSISVDGDYALIGAQRYHDTGAVFVFHNNLGTWEETQIIMPDDGNNDDFFGYSVDVFGDYAIIGAYQDDDSASDCGTAYIYYNNAGTWELSAKLNAYDPDALDFYGYSVSIFNDFALVGAYQDDDMGNQSGAVYSYKYNGSTWEFQNKINSDKNAATYSFGKSVDIYGHYSLIGANSDEERGTNAGAAYLFTNNCATFFTLELGNDTIFCKGDSVTIDAGSNGNSYLWSTGDTTQVVVIKNSDTLSLIISNNDGCEYYDTLEIIQDIPVVNLGNDTIIGINSTLTLDAGSDFESYLWDDNSTAQTYLIEGSVTGVDTLSISVFVTNSNTCSASDTINIIVQTLVSIDENDINNNIVVFPNPTQNGEFSINIGDEYNNVLLQIIDVNGKKITEKEITPNQPISMDNIPGIYIIHIINQKSNTIYKSKLIIQ